jgi:hypothetical protein
MMSNRGRAWTRADVLDQNPMYSCERKSSARWHSSCSGHSPVATITQMKPKLNKSAGFYFCGIGPADTFQIVSFSIYICHLALVFILCRYKYGKANLSVC